MKRITVFCGSSMGNDPAFKEQAMKLGQTLAQEHIEFVWGANVGLMGAVANGVLYSLLLIIASLLSYLTIFLVN